MAENFGQVDASPRQCWTSLKIFWASWRCCSQSWIQGNAVQNRANPSSLDSICLVMLWVLRDPTILTFEREIIPGSSRYAKCLLFGAYFCMKRYKVARSGILKNHLRGSYLSSTARFRFEEIQPRPCQSLGRGLGPNVADISWCCFSHGISKLCKVSQQVPTFPLRRKREFVNSKGGFPFITHVCQPSVTSHHLASFATDDDGVWWTISYHIISYLIKHTLSICQYRIAPEKMSSRKELL